MHERFERRIEEGLQKIAAGCRNKKQKSGVIERRVGRLLGRNTRAAKLFDVRVEQDDAGRAQLRWSKSQAWREWAPRLTKAREQFLTGRDAVRDRARAQILAISDPGAIPAMESILSSAGEPLALLAVAVLDKIPDHEATLSLARHAIQSASAPVRCSGATRLWPLCCGRPRQALAGASSRKPRTTAATPRTRSWDCWKWCSGVSLFPVARRRGHV